MNLFEIFNKKEYEDVKIIKKEDKLYSIKEIKEIIAPICAELKENKIKRVVITSKNHFDFFINYLASVYAEKDAFLLNDLKKISFLDFEYILLDKLTNKPKCDFEFETPNLKTTYLTILTSGSTGVPKQIRKNLSNVLIEAGDMIFEYQEQIKKDNTYIITSTTPHHMWGFSTLIGFVLYDPIRLIIDSREVIYPDDINLKDKIFISTPSFLEKFKKYDVGFEHAPRLILSAGDKLKNDVFEYFIKGKTPVKDIYGSTEVGVIAYRKSPDENFLTCYSLVEVKTNEDSLLIVNSPYFEGGDMVLGDIIEIIDNRHYIPKRRSDRIVKIQEKRISLDEIENILKEDEFIQNVYCFKLKEKLAAVVILNKEGREFYKKEERITLIKRLKSILADKSEIMPQKWRFLYEIPKTKTGKTDKEKMEEIFETNLSYPFIYNVEEKKDSTIIDLIFKGDSNFFKGHFDSHPILPGVVQLHYAFEFALYYLDENLKKENVKRIKFSNIIKPDTLIKLNLKRKENGIEYSYTKDEVILSSGFFEK